MAAATLPANAGGVFGYGGMGDTGGGGGGGFGGGGTPPGPNDHYNDDHDPEYCLDVGGEDEEGSEGTSDEEAEESDDGAPLPIKTVPGARPTTGGKGPWVPPHLRSFIGKKGPAAPRVETKPATPEKVEQPKTSKTDDGKPQTSKIDDGEPKTKKKKAPKDKLGYSFIDDPKNKYIPRQVFPKVKGGNQQSSGEFQCPDYTCSSNYKKGGLVRAEPLKRHWKTPSFKHLEDYKAGRLIPVGNGNYWKFDEHGNFVWPSAENRNPEMILPEQMQGVPIIPLSQGGPYRGVRQDPASVRDHPQNALPGEGRPHWSRNDNIINNDEIGKKPKKAAQKKVPKVTPKKVQKVAPKKAQKAVAKKAQVQKPPTARKTPINHHPDPESESEAPSPPASDDEQSAQGPTDANSELSGDQDHVDGHYDAAEQANPSDSESDPSDSVSAAPERRRWDGSSHTVNTVMRTARSIVASETGIGLPLASRLLPAAAQNNVLSRAEWENRDVAPPNLMLPILAGNAEPGSELKRSIDAVENAEQPAANRIWNGDIPSQQIQPSIGGQQGATPPVVSGQGHSLEDLRRFLLQHRFLATIEGVTVLTPLAAVMDRPLNELESILGPMYHYLQALGREGRALPQYFGPLLQISPQTGRLVASYSSGTDFRSEMLRMYKYVSTIWAMTDNFEPTEEFCIPDWGQSSKTWEEDARGYLAVLMTFSEEVAIAMGH